MQTSFILSRPIAIGLTTSQLPPLQDTVTLSPQLTGYRRSIFDMEKYGQPIPND